VPLQEEEAEEDQVFLTIGLLPLHMEEGDQEALLGEVRQREAAMATDTM